MTKIMIVEDSEDIRKLLRDHLEKYGYETVAATDFMAGLDDFSHFQAFCETVQMSEIMVRIVDVSDSDPPFETKDDMFAAFKLSLTPYIKAGKLAMVLFQFPPWFDCKKENVNYLRWVKEKMGDIPCALGRMAGHERRS